MEKEERHLITRNTNGNNNKQIYYTNVIMLPVRPSVTQQRLDLFKNTLHTKNEKLTTRGAITKKEIETSLNYP